MNGTNEQQQMVIQFSMFPSCFLVPFFSFFLWFCEETFSFCSVFFYFCYRSKTFVSFFSFRKFVYVYLSNSRLPKTGLHQMLKYYYND